MRFCTLNLLHGESPGYFGFQFYLDYIVTWVTTQGCLLHKNTNTHMYVCLCLCTVQKSGFLFLFRYIIQIKVRLYLTSLIFVALLNAA
jgi:hypothetical protein